MTSSIETRLDGSMLVVRIPMQFQRRAAASGLSLLTRARSSRPLNRRPTGRCSRRSPEPGAGRVCSMAVMTPRGDVRDPR
jgi:hypothetical protein